MGIEAKTKSRSITNSAEMDNAHETKSISRNILSLTPLPPPSTSTSPESSTPSLSSKEKIGNESEEERLNYFLECFSKVRSSTKDPQEEQDLDTFTRLESSYDEENLKPSNAQAINNTLSMSNNEQNRNNEITEVYETILTGHNDDTITVVTPSLWNDYDVLQSLRSTLHASDDESLGTVIGSKGISEAQQDSEEYQQQAKRQPHHDPTVALFFKFFEFAQSERLKKRNPAPYLVSGLFIALSEVRFDLEWAQDATYRRNAGMPYVAWADHYAMEKKRMYIPFFSCLMLFSCTMALLWAFYENDWRIEPLSKNPFVGPDYVAMVEAGALKGSDMFEGEKWWLLFTTIFLHGGVVHLLLNSIIFIVLGVVVEHNHGWLHTSLVFFASGVFGNMVSVLLQPNVILVGASGGIFGMYGACVADIILNSRLFFLVLEEEALKFKRKQDRKMLRRSMNRTGGEGGEGGGGRAANETSASDLIIQACDPVAIQCRRRWIRLKCYASLVLDLIFNFLLGCLPFLDNFAHAGGLLFGFFVSLSTLRLLSASSFDYHKKQVKSGYGRCCHKLGIFTLRCGGLLSALFMVLVTIGFMLQSDGTTSPCPKCHYASCIALPKPWKPTDPSNWWSCDECGQVHGNWYSEQDVNGEVFVASVEVLCPRGNTLLLDVAERRYTEHKEIADALPNLCREVCYE